MDRSVSVFDLNDLDRLRRPGHPADHDGRQDRGRAAGTRRPARQAALLRLGGHAAGPRQLPVLRRVPLGGRDRTVASGTSTVSAKASATRSSCRGHGVGMGRLHWTANFDEFQDFEGQIRHFQGTGLMADPDFTATSDPLGAPKAGLSADLDALAAYLASLVDTPASPHRQSDGSLTPAGLAGVAQFESLGCGSCHVGGEFTDSDQLVAHDVGTLGPLSGPQAALDTPTLRGAWATAPYLHDGSAATLEDAVAAHTAITTTPLQRSELAAYLRQDRRERIDRAQRDAGHHDHEPHGRRRARTENVAVDFAATRARSRGRRSDGRDRLVLGSRRAARLRAQLPDEHAVDRRPRAHRVRDRRQRQRRQLERLLRDPR